MRVAIIASPEVNFFQLEQILPRATRAILTDGSGPTEKNIRKYCIFTGISYKEFPPKSDSSDIHKPGDHLMKMMEQADLIVILWHSTDYEPGYAMSAALIDKMVQCYFVQDGRLFSLIPHPIPGLKK